MCIRGCRVIRGGLRRLLPPLFMLLTIACGGASKSVDVPGAPLDVQLPSALIASDVLNRGADKPFPYAKPGAAVRFFSRLSRRCKAG
jgi:hypothetical protein